MQCRRVAVFELRYCISELKNVNNDRSCSTSVYKHIIVDLVRCIIKFQFWGQGLYISGLNPARKIT